MVGPMRWLSCIAVLSLASGCVTVAEFRKLERQVIDMKRGRGGDGSALPRERLADLASRLDALEADSGQLGGRLEVAEHQAEQALAEARAARQEAANGVSSGVASVGGAGAIDASPPTGDASAAGTASDGGSSVELQAYRAGYAEWRRGEWTACVDRFRNFLQTYPSSAYADDAAYWSADCYFKQGDYKTAILRFDDVVSRYPGGNKAADALFRQGEALLQLGPGYGKAAGKAFERVLSEYPQSGRATEAKRQLELLETG
jgi:tol-pal system protein YbgF